MRTPSAVEKTTIAVIEDNEDNRLLVRAILAEHYEVMEYEDGPEALRGMRIAPPSLALLDVSLPGMDGQAVLKAMRREKELSRIPVVALTAHAMAGDRERLLSEGFDDYVSKPILNELILLAAIGRLLPARESR